MSGAEVLRLSEYHVVNGSLQYRAACRRTRASALLQMGNSSLASSVPVVSVSNYAGKTEPGMYVVLPTIALLS